jgi:hypothetical protein
MKEVRPPFSWKALLFDANTRKLKDYDVLKYRENLVKDLKKKCANKADFTDKLFRDFMWQYWSRCEYEMIMYIENGRVFVQPWVGCHEPEKYRVDITDRPGFNWPKFAEQIIRTEGYRDGTAKIDIYDQLKFRFDELADFCWEYKHKYQRTKKGPQE